jgi:hypothetical protein
MRAPWGWRCRERAAVFGLDCDVFIAANNAYYAFDICPGIWQALIRRFPIARCENVVRMRHGDATTQLMGVPSNGPGEGPHILLCSSMCEWRRTWRSTTSSSTKL